MRSQYKYFAFISYSSKDTKWGRRLQRKLESYRMPAKLCRKRGWKRTPIDPVFFAPTDIQPGDLSQELQERLRASQHLIVICSPNSAKSDWVAREISFFHSLGRAANIHLFIVEGIPGSGGPATECFNAVLQKLGMGETLGVNINEQNFRRPWLNRERAYVQLISKLLNVEFDELWQRHRRLFIQKIAAWTVGCAAVLTALGCVWTMNQPVNVEMRLNECSVHNAALPPLRNAVVTMTIENEIKNDTIPSLDGSAVFSNIPHRALRKPARIRVECEHYEPVDTMLLLSERVVLDIRRDENFFGNIRFRLFSPERNVAGVRLGIAGREVVTDEAGAVSLFVPLAEQQTTYRITSSVPLVDETLYMPCGDGTYILIDELRK